MKRNLAHLSIILLSILTWAVRAQTDQELPDLSPDANKPVESFTLSGDWQTSTNTLATPEVLAARVAAAAEWAAATNTEPSITREPQVRSSSFGDPPPPALWVAEPDGNFTAKNTTFQANLAGTLNVEGALTVAIPNGEPGTYLRGTILALAYREPGELGRSVTIAKSKPVQGQLHTQDQVIFREAFNGEGVVADVVYQLAAYSIAQDVVIRGRLPDPEYYGLSSDSALTVVSEFYASPAPMQVAGTDGDPEVLRWGRMGMIQGRVFSLGEEPDSCVNVRKTWTQFSGRQVLLESLPYSQIRNQMEALPVLEPPPTDQTTPTGPESEGGSLGPVQPDDTLLAGNGDLFRSLPTLRAPISACPLALAVNSRDWPALDATGLVIDYILTWPQPVISINFAGAVKTGFAAVGQSDSDSWNQYSFQNDGTLQDLHWTDSAGHNSGASVTVSGVMGNWNFTCCMPSIDNMYDGYLYQYGWPITLAVNSLPAGTYHFYLYGHGPAQNANTIFTFGTTNLSTSATDPYWNTALWTNGLQYVIFSNITVAAGQQISFTANPGISAYSILNGMQIVPVNILPDPPTITSHPQSISVGQGGAVSFSVTATGTAPLTYQWRKGVVNISGATASTYTIVGVQPADAGSYSIAVSNPGGTSYSANASLTIAGSACAAPASGLIAWWPGDDSTMDLGRGHQVSLFGNATYHQATVNSGFSFDVNGAYAIVPSASSAGDLNVGPGSGFTFEAWIQPLDTASRPIFEWCDSGHYGVHFWANYPGGGYLYANIVDTGGATHAILASGLPPLNTLTHVAVTYDKSAGGVAKLFINGVKRAESTLGVFTPQTSVDFHLGYRALGLGWGGSCFYGRIDEPTIYDRALADAEITSIFSTGSTGKCKALLGDLSDPDYDGVPTWQELNSGTNPYDSTSVPRVRLGYWAFSDATCAGERGQLPKSQSGAQSVVGWIGNATDLNPGGVVYNTLENDATANINCRQGMLRFRFAPHWSSGNGPGGTGGDLINVGGGWRLSVNATGNLLSFSAASGGLSTTVASAAITWQANQWHQVCLSYSPSACTLFIDGLVAATGPGLPYYPSAWARWKYGLSVGSDSSGNSPAFGIFDELETFNYDQPRKAVVFGAYRYDRYLTPTASHASGNYLQFLNRAPEGWECWMNSLPMQVTSIKREVYFDSALGMNVARISVPARMYFEVGDQVNVRGLANPQYNTASAKVLIVINEDPTYSVSYANPGADVGLTSGRYGQLYDGNYNPIGQGIHSCKRVNDVATVYTWVDHGRQVTDLISIDALPGFNVDWHTPVPVTAIGANPQPGKYLINYSMPNLTTEPAQNDLAGIITRNGINICGQSGFTLSQAANHKFQICMDYAPNGEWRGQVSDAEQALAAGLATFTVHRENSHYWYQIVSEPQPLRSPPFGLMPVGGGCWSGLDSSSSVFSYGPELEFVDAVNQWVENGVTLCDAAESWAHSATAAKYAKLKDMHPDWNVLDLRQLLRQTSTYYRVGWDEMNGYGFAQIANRAGMAPGFIEWPINAQLQDLEPGPPLQITAQIINNGTAVSFTWRNYTQTDFVASAIARVVNGQPQAPFYQGSGASYTWNTGQDIRGLHWQIRFHTVLSGSHPPSRGFTIMLD